MSMKTDDVVIDEAGFSVRRTIRIAAPVASVWRAVTEPEHVSAWFGELALEGSGVGARGTIAFPRRGAVPLVVEDVDEPRSISYRWSNDDALVDLPDAVDPDHSTVFTFSLEPVEGGTRLTVVETGFEATSSPRANLDAHAEGWTVLTDRLVVLLEGGA
jgi:uncharacterized protein YndB with AHSA1/START domain